VGSAAADLGQVGEPLAGAGSPAILPFHIRVPEAALEDLRRRLAATRLPEVETVADDSQGVPLKTVQQLLRYWQSDYDWRRAEAQLNAAPNFLTKIDDLDIHFIHVRSKHENALPLIVTHGWPYSVVSLLKIIGPLTNPTGHGGSAADAFHLVIPSMPGYGFSGKPTATGWGPERIARTWTTLMRRLGYTAFVAQGGDWGSLVTEQMAVQAPPELMGIHTNMPAVVPEHINAATFAGAPPPQELSPDERTAYDALTDLYRHIYYAFYQGSRPQTLTALADSPVGLATWMLDLEARSLAMIARAFDGQPADLTRDEVLDNVTLYWLTNTAVSSARLYWENKLPYFVPKGVTIPVAVKVFPDELYQAPRSWAASAYPRLVHFNKVNKGGHYAAWDQPAIFSRELRDGFRSLRTI
jgi:pimeloyl-ACP methyl ester carboxylesterase